MAVLATTLMFAELPPDWVHVQTPIPSKGNNTIFYQVIAIDNEADINKAEKLAERRAREVGMSYKRNWINVQTGESTEDELFVGVNRACPPYEEIKNGKTTYYFLYQISKGGDMPNYEPCDCKSTKIQEGLIKQDKDLRTRAIKHIQARAIPASVFVPGVGQMVKGQYTKGGLMLAGEVIGVGGIIASYSMKSSYERLMEEDPKFKQDYSDKADMWQNIGYGCIGVAAAVYLYSLIDVIVARPSDKTINKVLENMTFAPVVTSNGGVGLAMQVKF